MSAFDHHRYRRALRAQARSRNVGIHHAPWSRHFRTMFVTGSFAYELQVGSVVVQWFYEPWEHATFARRLHVWRDPFQRRSYLRCAPWGV